MPNAKEAAAMAEARDPYWLVLPRVIRGAEGEGGDGGSGDGGTGGSGDDKTGGTDDDKDKQKGSSKDGDNDGLKSALEKERKARGDAEKELKALRKFKEEQEAKGRSDAENATASAEKASKQAAAAMEALRRTASKAAVMAVLREHPFKNPDAAAKSVQADLPDDFFDLDEDSMELKFDEDKLKELATNAAKSGDYVMVQADGDDDDEGDQKPPPKSGSAHGGRRDQKTKQADDDALRSKYGLSPPTTQKRF